MVTNEPNLARSAEIKAAAEHVEKHRTEHRCVDGRRYYSSCLVTDYVDGRYVLPTQRVAS